MVISIIALLTSILLPGLKAAREAGRATVCLSNEHQLAIALTVYTNDYHNFPVGPQHTYWDRARFGWGGVHWYGFGDPAEETPNQPAIFVPAERVLNPYIAPDAILQARAKVFRCPSDTNVFYHKSGEPVAWTWNGYPVDSGEAAESVFTQLGTSYEINVWMYCRSDAAKGYGVWELGFDKPPANWLPHAGPHMVTRPGDFIVFGDIGNFSPGWYSDARLEAQNFVTGWWHGYRRSHVSFLDGSARAMDFKGQMTGPGFTVLLDPLKWKPGSWRRPDGP